MIQAFPGTSNDNIPKYDIKGVVSPCKDFSLTNMSLIFPC